MDEALSQAILLLEATQHTLNQLPNQKVTQRNDALCFYHVEDTYGLVKQIDAYFEAWKFPG